MSKAWMPFYGGDFIANTLHLNRGEIGSYVLLLWHHWEHGSLPADERELRQIARVHPWHWPRVWKHLKPFFTPDKDNPIRIHQSRILIELHKKDEISNKRKAAAVQMHSKRDANAKQKHTQSQSQSPYKEVTVTVKPSSQSNGVPGRAGSNGPRPGDATIGERMGKYVWDGTHWAEAEHWTPRPPHAFGDPR
jgi:uncharacterized protein YdaU (DUF1376 family)